VRARRPRFSKLGELITCPIFSCRRREVRHAVLMESTALVEVPPMPDATPEVARRTVAVLTRPGVSQSDVLGVVRIHPAGDLLTTAVESPQHRDRSSSHRDTRDRKKRPRNKSRC
jgi:hypothetical protein